MFENPKDLLKLECLRDSDAHKKKVLVASTDKIEYKGDNFSTSAGPSRFLFYLFICLIIKVSFNLMNFSK